MGRHHPYSRNNFNDHGEPNTTDYIKNASFKPSFLFVMLIFLRLFDLIRKSISYFIIAMWQVRFNSHRTEVFRIGALVCRELVVPPLQPIYIFDFSLAIPMWYIFHPYCSRHKCFFCQIVDMHVQNTFECAILLKCLVRNIKRITSQCNFDTCLFSKKKKKKKKKKKYSTYKI